MGELFSEEEIVNNVLSEEFIQGITDAFPATVRPFKLRPNLYPRNLAQIIRYKSLNYWVKSLKFTLEIWLFYPRNKAYFLEYSRLQSLISRVKSLIFTF